MPEHRRRNPSHSPDQPGRRSSPEEPGAGEPGRNPSRARPVAGREDQEPIDVEDIPDEGTPELPDPETMRVDRSIPVDDVVAEPSGIQEVRDLDTTVGAAASGVLIDDDVDENKQRLHDVQVILIELGYFVDRDSGHDVADGVWGPETRDAVAAFQTDHELDASGQIDSDTYEALLAEHELALGAHSPGDDVEEDAFAPIRPEKPLSD